MKKKTMKVVILCGGEGTRMREETEFRPKPLVDIGGRPIVWHIMKLYAHYGFKDFILCLGYRGHMLKEYFLNCEKVKNDCTVSLGPENRIISHGAYDEQGFQVTLVDTGLSTMTGGRVKHIEEYIDGDHFMVTYGDGVSNIDIAELLKFHQSHGKLATMTTVRPTSRFGQAAIDETGKVSRFIEKPQLEGWINSGFFIFNKKVFNYLGDDDCVLEREPLERLAQDGELFAYRHNDFFFAMDTYREYKLLQELWNKGNAPWKVWK